MCRLVGIVASEPTAFGLCLTEAPRCLATLSREHPDGWGVAIHDTDRWHVHKGTERAHDDRRFRELAGEIRGHVLVAHIRQKTVGPTRLENTHPFERDGWIFAHNGTITRQDVIRARVPGKRLAEIAGDTDSELLFAYLLTRFEDAGLLRLDGEESRANATKLLASISTELRTENVGAFNFLLSDGVTFFAHRTGRSLFLLERGRESGAPRPRKRAVLVASERITDEAWRELPEGTLLRIDRTPEPIVKGDEPASPRAA